MNLLEIAGLGVRYRDHQALTGVSLAVPPNTTVGLVGESGSGKTTLGRAVLGLVPVAEGVIRLAGRDITHLRGRARRGLSGQVQVVFQNPYLSFNPSRTIGQAVAEPLTLAGLRPAQLRGRVDAMLDRVGLDRSAADRYPSRFSGGQLQRIAIARALMPGPRLLICDEAVSALDLSVQAHVLNLLADLQAEQGLSYLFITHDLAVVRHIADRVVVLRRGEVVEAGPVEQVCSTDPDVPRHPYTRALLAAAPVPDPAEQARRRALRAAPAQEGPVPCES
ncbi:ATP-binding cassette domain-containing protein [Actinokineospora auranticolor]|uniref:Peptide/nickel transport system ATP-binding protein n=1 Tax=Actinokineospora auranticolor TaxID=155976 RepID=A0A2S6GEI2_9PSEU|nr:ATP-binding cassette domain-containing protein [Actinokineospora auranticolor]PPK63638.1 peptide/nickel transport system ATP-binding protein [Actinokineospora auranticolor]